MSFLLNAESPRIAGRLDLQQRGLRQCVITFLWAEFRNRSETDDFFLPISRNLDHFQFANSAIECNLTSWSLRPAHSDCER